jgi:hypothetical protein
MVWPVTNCCFVTESLTVRYRNFPRVKNKIMISRNQMMAFVMSLLDLHRDNFVSF